MRELSSVREAAAGSPVGELTAAIVAPGLRQAEFEQVLHPIFQEDEFTLIVVGGVLGLAVGWLQAVFTQPEPEDAGGFSGSTAGSGSPA